MFARGEIYLLLVVGFLLCSTYETSANEKASKHLDELDPKSARSFLEKKIDTLSAKKGLIGLIRGSSLKDQLEGELKQMREAPKDETSLRQFILFEEFIEFLYKPLEEALCSLQEGPEFALQNLRPHSSLAGLVTETRILARQTRTKLDDLLQDRLLKQIEFCKPHWDALLLAKIEGDGSLLTGEQRNLMYIFYNHLIAYVADRFAAWDGIKPDTALASFSQFMDLLKEPPRPGSVSLFMTEQFPMVAEKLALDANMKNRNLKPDTLGWALQQTVKPLCTSVCQSLKPMGDFYLRDVFQPMELTMKSADEARNWRLAQLYHLQPAQVTKALIVQSACCKLLGPKFSDKIVKRVFEDITGAKV